MKSIKDMKNLEKGKKGETESYEPPKHLVKPHEGEKITPYVEQEYEKSKKNSGTSPFVTKYYKEFMERRKKSKK